MFLLDLDRIAVAHLHRALSRYEAELRRDAQYLPDGLQALRDALCRVRAGQDGPAEREANELAQGAAMTPMLVTFDRAAVVLDVSTSTVKRLVKSGELAAVKVAGATRVRCEDLADYVARLAPTNGRRS